MQIFDQFFYTIYLFLHNKLRRNTEDARTSALMFFVLYITSSIFAVFYFIGLIRTGVVCDFFMEHSFLLFMIISVIFFTIFGLRYFRFVEIEQLDNKWQKHSKRKQRLFIIFTILYMIIIPTCLFIFFRLYKFGHI